MTQRRVRIMTALRIGAECLEERAGREGDPFLAAELAGHGRTLRALFTRVAMDEGERLSAAEIVQKIVDFRGPGQ